MVVFLTARRREILQLPDDIRSDLADALARLDAGHTLSMPLSRPLPSIGRGAHELRLRDRSGAYRVVYAIVKGAHVHVVPAFKKTTQATPRKHIELARKRIKEDVR